MDEIYTLEKYFPLKISEPRLSEYFEHHLSSLICCVENELYSSAYSHLHILYMVFVYIQLLRISREKSENFELCWIGFPNQEKDFLKKPSSPFSFSKVKEKSIFRFFRLLDFDDSCIGNISSLVKTRNEHLHANGQLFFKMEEDFSKELINYIGKIEIIINKQKNFLENIYESLSRDYDDDFEIILDEIEINFAEQYLFSEYELKLLAEGKKDVISKFINDM
jgi:hypothetical protein